MKVLACLAWLMGVTVPADLPLPQITELPIAQSIAECERRGAHPSRHAEACYDRAAGEIIVPEGRIDPGTLFHELAHHVQAHSGVDLKDWRSENRAEFAARKAAAGWCRDV